MASFQRILLTGGAGFVGSYLAPLIVADYPSASRRALTLGGEAQALDKGFEPVCGDILDASRVDAIVKELRPDLVLHLAGQASIGKALGAAETTWRVNFHGSFNLACALARHAPEAMLLFASSVSVYGASLLDGPATETTPLRPLDAYGRSKAAAEAALFDLLPAQARLIVARPVNHSGPRQNEKSFVLASFAAQIAAIEADRAEPRLRVGDLSKARDFLDVRDVVEAYRLLVAKADQLEARGVFNIACGEPRIVGDLLEGLRRRAKRRFVIETDASLLRPAAVDIPTVACDASKLAAATGWRPRHSMDDLLQSLLDHWREKEACA